VRRRVWLRAGALALAVVGVIAGLTAYYSSEPAAPCVVSGVPTWRPLTDGKLHRYLVVFPDRAACFYDLDAHNQLVASLRLPDARDIVSAAPNGDRIALRSARGPVTLDLQTGRLTPGGLVPWPSDTLTETDVLRRVMYVTQRGLLGYRVISLRSGATEFVAGRRTPGIPSHGLCVAPNAPRLWVLDSRNSLVAVDDVRRVPAYPPRYVGNVRVAHVRGSGSLLCSADGRFVYVGGSGDVIDARLRTVADHLEALEHTSVMLEVDWAGGRPFFPAYPR
jgi:hypothetical protein